MNAQRLEKHCHISTFTIVCRKLHYATEIMVKSDDSEKKHLNEFRELIIKQFLNGDSEHEITRRMLCSRNTLHSMIVKYKKKQMHCKYFPPLSENEKQQNL